MEDRKAAQNEDIYSSLKGYFPEKYDMTPEELEKAIETENKERSIALGFTDPNRSQKQVMREGDVDLCKKSAPVFIPMIPSRYTIRLFIPSPTSPIRAKLINSFARPYFDFEKTKIQLSAKLTARPTINPQLLEKILPNTVSFPIKTSRTTAVMPKSNSVAIPLTKTERKN